MTPENSCPITSGMGTARWPLYMWGSVPQTPQWVGRRIAPSRGGGDSGKLSIESLPGASSTAAWIILPPLASPRSAYSSAPAIVAARGSARAGTAARPRIPIR
jgi:hypothetical protein